MTDKLDVRVEKHTQLDGAVLNSDTGNLTLDTGTLGFSDIKDHDTGTSIGGQIGLSYSTDYDANGDGVVDKGSGGPGGNLSGSYASHDIEQETKATVGEGAIIVRDKDKQKQDVAALNRDVTQAQVITKNEQAGVQVYASDSSIGEIVSGFAGIQSNLSRLPVGLKNVPNDIKQAVKEAAEGLDLVGKTFEQAVGMLVEEQVKTGSISPEDGQKLKSIQKSIDKKAVQDALVGCSGQQAFNALDLIFTPAYAAGVCTIPTSSGPIPISPGLARQALAYLYEAGVAAGAATMALAAGFLVASTNSTGGLLNREVKEQDGTRIILRGSGDTVDKTLTVISASGEETRYVIDRLPTGEYAVKEGFTISNGREIKIDEQEMMDIADKALFGTGIVVAVNGNPDHKYYPKPRSPQDITGFPGLKAADPKGGRPRWKDDKGKIYEWDKQHGTLEVYDKTGKKHLGEFDPKTGKQTKPADPSRWTPK